MNLVKSSLEALSKRENLFHGDEKVRPVNILVADRYPVSLLHHKPFLSETVSLLLPQSKSSPRGK